MSELDRSLQNSSAPPPPRKNNGNAKLRRIWKGGLQILEGSKNENWIRDFIV